jgi:NAD(P)-dependent dehydrogenase (short-subunit alcohol dehydrogenase family)
MRTLPNVLFERVLDRTGFERTTGAKRLRPGVATLNVIAVSAVRLISALMPHMREQRWGRVIQIGNAASANPPPSLAGYGAAKAALVNLTVSLAKDNRLHPREAIRTRERKGG